MGIPVHKVPGPEQRPPNSDFTSPSSLQPQHPAPPSNATGTTYAVPPEASQAQREGPAPRGRATWGGSPALHLGTPPVPASSVPGVLPTGLPTTLGFGLKHGQRFLVTTVHGKSRTRRPTAGALGTPLPLLGPLCHVELDVAPAPWLSGEEALPQTVKQSLSLRFTPVPLSGGPTSRGRLRLHRAVPRWAPEADPLHQG